MTTQMRPNIAAVIRSCARPSHTEAIAATGVMIDQSTNLRAQIIRRSTSGSSSAARNRVESEPGWFVVGTSEYIHTAMMTAKAIGLWLENMRSSIHGGMNHQPTMTRIALIDSVRIVS